MSTEEDFACDNFTPQKWRKDMCRHCYQSQRLHVKKQIKSESRTGSKTSSPKATSPQATTKPFVPPSTPPLVTSPTPPGSYKPGKMIPAKPNPPARPGVPQKPSPPAKTKGSVSPPSKPKGSTSSQGEPKVFQRFRVNRDLGIDKSIPARERTQKPELEGVRPGIVQHIQDLSTTRQQDVPQAAVGSPSPPPPVIPPRPPGYELSLESKTPSNDSTPTKMSTEQSSISTTPAEVKQPSVPAAERPPDIEQHHIAAEIEQPSVPAEIEQPSVPAEIEQPSVPAEIEQPPVAAEIEQPSVPTEIEQPSVPAEIEQPSVPAEIEQPSVPAEIEQPPVAAEIEQPPVPAEIEQPLVPAEIEQPSVAAEIEQPPVAAEIEQPSVPAEIEQPSVPAEIEQPSVPAEIEQPSVPAEIEQPSVPAEIEQPYTTSDVPAEDTKEEVDTLDTVQQEPPSNDTSTDPIPISESNEQQPVEENLPETKDTPPTVDDIGNVSMVDQPTTVEQTNDVEQTVTDTSTVAAVTTTPGDTDNVIVDDDSWVMVNEVVEQQVCPVVESGFKETGSDDETGEHKDDEQSTEEDGTQQSQEIENETNKQASSEAATDELQTTSAETETLERGSEVEVSGDTEETMSTNREEDQLPKAVGGYDPDEVVKSKIVTVPNDEIQPIENNAIPPPQAVPAVPSIVPPTEADVVPAPPDLSNGVPVPPPPPPPPPVVTPTPSPKLPRAKDIKEKFQSEKIPSAASAHDEAMEAIKGGVKLKVAPPPKQRAIGEEKVVDVASELRQKLLKKKKKENVTLASQVEAHYEELQKMKELLVSCRGTHSFLHQLQSLLSQVDTLVAKTNVPPEILAQRLQWPTYLVDALREVVEHMKTLQTKVIAAENLCKRTLANSMQPTGTGQTSSASSSNINPAAVEKCVQDVVLIAKELNTDESRYFRASQSFAVDESDVQRLIQRASDAVCPLLDKVYDKAFHAHRSIYEPSVTKFDQGFRVQNARRLLRLATNMSDLLSLHLQVPKHACYSEALLKCSDLPSDFHSTIKVTEKEGQWDIEEQLELGSIGRTNKSMKEDTQLVQSVMKCLSSENGCLTDELETQLTTAVLTRIELQLIKSTMATGNTQTVSNVMAVISKVYAGDNEAIHRCDFDWLLEAVTKGNIDCLEHLIKSCDVFVNCQASGGITILHRAVQRQNIPTVALLIRLGADPLIKNAYDSSPAQVLALKCFPPAKLTDKVEEREPLFDLSSYINNPSLSDVIITSSDNKQFNAHRIILCAQSPVLKTMMDSDVWAESSNKEIPLPTVSGKVVQFMLKYLYTGECKFPRDDLNLAIELMAAADQFILELMKQQCERVLCEKIDLEVAVPLYYAAFQFSAPKLLANCQHFILSHYHELEDSNYELLLHILDNAVSGKQL